MCGIFCAISQDGDVDCRLSSQTLALLNNRGPDVQDQLLMENVLLAGSVLWQQGSQVQKQPIIRGHYAVLFNGDLYNAPKPSTISDTSWLAEKLGECKGDNDMVSLLKQMEGPHCLLVYNTRDRILYFSRDALGRNSLIVERYRHGLNLMSTSYYVELEDLMGVRELPPLGMYKLMVDDLSQCILYPWQPLNDYSEKLLSEFQTTMNWTTDVKYPIEPNWLLKNSNEGQGTTYDFYDFPFNKNPDEFYANLLESPAVKQTLRQLDNLLTSSVAARVQNTAPVCRDCSSACRHAKVCILFSGGIDCSILALLADKFVPNDEPIELINVAFESSNGWNVPDRLTSLQSHAELQRLCPSRQWQLLEVNVTRQNLQQQLSTHIRHLIYPLQSVLDESLGCAFWFAVHDATSKARVAILGSGADELFGGYTRHRNAYKRCPGNEQACQQAVSNELELDWQRIPSRNLARDDRVIADTGKTARAPFIEENFVQFVRSLDPKQRCCYTFPEGFGDKLLLRLYGYQMGLRDAVLLKKRAIQFGSRIANKKQQAAQLSTYLQFTVKTSSGIND